MSADLDPLILDLVQRIPRGPRAYADAMDAWRTSCPRLTVWEDALDRGAGRAGVHVVAVTEEGRWLLASSGRLAA